MTSSSSHVPGCLSGVILSSFFPSSCDAGIKSPNFEISGAKKGYSFKICRSRSNPVVVESKGMDMDLGDGDSNRNSTKTNFPDIGLKSDVFGFRFACGVLADETNQSPFVAALPKPWCHFRAPLQMFPQQLSVENDFSLWP